MSFTDDEKKATVADIQKRIDSEGEIDNAFQLAYAVINHCKEKYSIEVIDVFYVGSPHNEHSAAVMFKGLCIKEMGVWFEIDKFGVEVSDDKLDKFFDDVLPFVWKVHQVRVLLDLFYNVSDAYVISTAEDAYEKYKQFKEVEISKNESCLIKAVFKEQVAASIILKEETNASLRIFTMVMEGYLTCVAPLPDVKVANTQ